MTQAAQIFHALPSPLPVKTGITASERRSAKTVRWIDRFYIVQELAHAPASTVYLAYDPVIERNVAIKRFNYDLSPIEKKRIESYFLGKGNTAGRLAHPNIMQIHEVSSEGSQTYIVMEYLDGNDLGKVLEDGKNFTIHETCAIICKIAKALDHAHRNNVIHRNIKPANIFVTHDNQVKIADFGLALLPGMISKDANANPSLVHHNLHDMQSCMSPEQATGQVVDYRSDIYSLGAVMYEMLTHKKPFHLESASKLLDAIAGKNFPAPHELNAAIQTGLSQIIMKAMRKDQDLRYPNVKEMANDIKRWLLNEQETIAKKADIPVPEPVLATQKKEDRTMKTLVAANAPAPVRSAPQATEQFPRFLWGNAKDAEQREQVIKAYMYMFFIMALTLFSGVLILKGFGISFGSLHVAGGLTIAVVGYRMLFQINSKKNELHHATPSFVRPEITSPCAIATLLSISTEIATLPTEHQKAFAYSIVCAGMVLIFLITGYAPRLSRFFSEEKGRDSMIMATRLSGFMMICIGVQYAATGVRSFLSVA